jgi:hypothetical protein
MPDTNLMMEQTQGSNKIFAAEHDLRVLIDNTEDPLWLVGSDYKIVECNNAFRKWVACFIDVELGNGDDVLYNGQNQIYHNKFEMCYRLAFNGHTFKSVEDMMVDNELRYTNITFNPVRSSDGLVTSVCCFAKDITEHRKHLLRIEQQNTALREIAFIESHKIRGPVATILGLEQFYNYTDLSDPLNKDIMEGIKKISLELDVIIREVVRKSNEIGM